MRSMMMSFDRPTRYTRFLSRDEVARVAPSVFAERASDTTSSRYEYISTVQIFNLLEENGYLPTQVRVGKDKEFGKHMVAFQHRDQEIILKNVGDTKHQLILYNSHDGKSAYGLIAGALKLVCTNGLIVSDGEKGTFKIRHQGQDVLYNVARGIHEMNRYLPVAFGQIEEWANMEVGSDLSQLYGEAVLMGRYGKNGHDLITPDGHVIKGNPAFAEDVLDVTPIHAPVTIAEVIKPHRIEDRKPDLYTLYNVVQENIVTGGMKGQVINKNGQIKQRRTRGVNGIEQDRKINQSLWVLTQAFEQLVKENKAELVF